MVASEAHERKGFVAWFRGSSIFLGLVLVLKECVRFTVRAVTVFRFQGFVFHTEIVRIRRHPSMWVLQEHHSMLRGCRNPQY